MWFHTSKVSPMRSSATPKAAPASRSSPTKDLASIHKRFENSRKLFGREGGTGTVAEGVNDIARATAEAREKDMELLRSRFKRTNEAEEKPKTPEKTSAEQDTYYPGVNSLKKIKVSPPKNGQMYPDLNDIYATTDSDRDRPETAMSGESAAVSEAPSLGTAIKRVASTRSDHKLNHSPSFIFLFVRWANTAYLKGTVVLSGSNYKTRVY